MHEEGVYRKSKQWRGINTHAHMVNEDCCRGARAQRPFRGNGYRVVLYGRVAVVVLALGASICKRWTGSGHFFTNCNIPLDVEMLKQAISRHLAAVEIGILVVAICEVPRLDREACIQLA